MMTEPIAINGEVLMSRVGKGGALTCAIAVAEIDEAARSRSVPKR